MTINQCNATYNKLMNLKVEVSSGSAKMSLLHVAGIIQMKSKILNLNRYFFDTCRC